LIAINRSDAAAEALVNLLGLRLDGAASEELSCQIIIRGSALSSRLERLQAKSVVESCQSTFYGLRMRDVTDVKVERICRTEDDVRKDRDRMLMAIKSKAVCDLYYY